MFSTTKEGNTLCQPSLPFVRDIAPTFFCC
jgi:hypothetical protein